LKNLYHCIGWGWSIDWRSSSQSLRNSLTPLYLKRDEIDRVLAHAREKAKNGNFTDLRNVVILYLPFYGLQPEDIRRFKAGDIEFKSMKIGEERRC